MCEETVDLGFVDTARVPMAGRHVREAWRSPCIGIGELGKCMCGLELCVGLGVFGVKVWRYPSTITLVVGLAERTVCRVFWSFEAVSLIWRTCTVAVQMV